MTASPAGRLPTQHFPKIRHDLIEYCGQVWCRLLGGGLPAALADQRVDLAALANQPVELRRHPRRRLRVRAGFVQDVDGFVGAGPFRHEAVRQDDGCFEGVVGDGDGVVALEARPPRDQHLPRLHGVELFDGDGLEPPLQRGIVADPAIVFFAGRGADHANVAAHQRGLQHVGGVHRGAQRGSLAHKVVQLVDEQDQVGIGGKGLDQAPQALFVLAAKRRAGEQGDVIERQDPRVFQGRRHVSGGDALRQTFDDDRLADARFADERGVVLVLAQQDVHDAGDFVVAAAHGLEVAAARLHREVHPHALEHAAVIE